MSSTNLGVSHGLKHNSNYPDKSAYAKPAVKPNVQKE